MISFTVFFAIFYHRPSKKIESGDLHFEEFSTENSSSKIFYPSSEALASTSKEKEPSNASQKASNVPDTNAPNTETVIQIEAPNVEERLFELPKREDRDNLQQVIKNTVTPKGWKDKNIDTYKRELSLSNKTSHLTFLQKMYCIAANEATKANILKILQPKGSPFLKIQLRIARKNFLFGPGQLQNEKVLGILICPFYNDLENQGIIHPENRDKALVYNLAEECLDKNFQKRFRDFAKRISLPKRVQRRFLRSIRNLLNQNPQEISLLEEYFEKIKEQEYTKDEDGTLNPKVVKFEKDPKLQQLCNDIFPVITYLIENIPQNDALQFPD